MKREVINPRNETHPEPAGRGPSRYQDLQLSRRQMLEFASRLPQFLDQTTWPPERLASAREHQLRRLLAIAKKRSPWHARRLAKIIPENFREADIERLPVMTKQDLMSHFDEIVTDRRITLEQVENHLADLQADRYFADRYHAVTSGGSSGRRGVFVYDWDGWIGFGLSAARPLALMKSAVSTAQRAEKAALIAGNDPTYATTAFVLSFAPWISAMFGIPTPLSATLPVATLVERLNKLQPTRLSGYPSILRQLCHAAEQGELKLSLTSILVGAEPLYAETRETLLRIFGAPVFDCYGCTEAGNVGFTCSAGKMHLTDDTAIMELVTDSGTPVAAGATSARIYLTNLFNTLLPLIRFQIDDCVTLAETQERCGCGSYFRRIAAIQGRVDEIFVYPHNVAVHPVGLRHVLEDWPGIESFQAIQTINGMDVSVQAGAAIDMDGLAQSLTSVLRQAGLTKPKVALARVERIAPNAAGKVRRFIALPVRRADDA